MDVFDNENSEVKEANSAFQQEQSVTDGSPTIPEDASAMPEETVSAVEEAFTAQEEPVAETVPEVSEQEVIEPELPNPQKRSRKSGKLAVRLLAAVLAVVILLGSCYLTGSVLTDRWEECLEQVTNAYDAKLKDLEKQIESAAANSGNSVSGSPAAVGDGMTPSQVYASNVKSVVMIYAEISTSVFGQVSKSTSTGSGFILTDTGYIVTNYHVVESATALRVLLHDGTQVDAELIGADSANDVALLKIEHEGLQAVQVGSSSNLIVGDQVVAIGNPLGELTSTLTVGYVSAKERDVSTDGTVINMIQTDAAINSGNSGGPLFNMRGEVVGITTAKYSGTSNSGATIEGIGFAIPIDDVYDMLDDLMNYGYITGAYMGIEVSDTNADAATYFGYPLGAYVHGVEKGSCAQKAGIMAKDIIIALGDYEVGGLNDLSRALRKFDAGDTTTVVVYRLGQEITLTITFDAKPQSESTP